MTKRSKAALTVVLAALVLCVGGFAWSYQPIEVSDNHHDTKDAHEKTGITQPLLPSGVVGSNEMPPKVEGRASQDKEPAQENSVTNFFEKAFLVRGLRILIEKLLFDPVTWFTFVLAIYTVGLWRSTADLAREARQSGIRQAQDSRESLELARKALEVTREAYIASERPWVAVIPKLTKDIVGQVGKPITLHLSFEVKNYGRSPARELYIWCCGFTTTNGTDIFNQARRRSIAAGVEHGEQGIGIMLFPQETATIEASTICTLPTEYDTVSPFMGQTNKDRLATAYISGSVFFKSAMDQTQRETEFSYRISHRRISDANGTRIPVKDGHIHCTVDDIELVVERFVRNVIS